jgi:hypothetical protein
LIGIASLHPSYEDRDDSRSWLVLASKRAGLPTRQSSV